MITYATKGCKVTPATQSIYDLNDLVSFQCSCEESIAVIFSTLNKEIIFIWPWLFPVVNGAKWYNKGMHGNSEHTCTASIYDMSPCQLMIHVINEFMVTMYKPVKQVFYNLIMWKKTNVVWCTKKRHIKYVCNFSFSCSYQTAMSKSLVTWWCVFIVGQWVWIRIVPKKKLMISSS